MEVDCRRVPNEMDILDLRIFSRLARVQNLSAVGTELGLSAGTISKRLQALEAELGVRLFDRTTRSMGLTEEGSILLTQIEQVLCDLDAALATTSASVERPRGRLRVAAPTSLGRGMVAPAVCAFLAEYPDVEVHVDLTDRQVSFPDSGYDVAIRCGHLPDSSLIAKRLASDPRILVASPRYLAAAGSPEVPADLARHSCLILGDDQHWTLRQGDKSFDVRVSGRLRSDNAELLRHAALEGFGILKISQARVSEAVRRKLLQHVLPAYETDEDAAIWAIYPTSRHMLPKLRVFLEFVSNWFRDQRRTSSVGPTPAAAKAVTEA